MVGKLYRLTTFDASGTKINDDQLDYIAWMPTLHTLNLSRTKVTDAGLEKLASLDNLQWLVLLGHRRERRRHRSLASMKTLGRLTIDGTKVTPVGIARLKKALPKLVWRARSRARANRSALPPHFHFRDVVATLPAAVVSCINTTRNPEVDARVSGRFQLRNDARA